MQEEMVATTCKGPGEKLKFARESLGLSIWDVASQLYLPERIIRALEEDDYHDGMPVRAFVRGYVQSYSKLLDLPTEEMLAEFDGMGIYKKPQEVSLKPLVQPRVVLTVHKDKFWFAIVGGSVLAILTLIVALTCFNTHKEKNEDIVNQTLQDETLIDQAQIAPQAPMSPTVMPIAPAPTVTIASTEIPTPSLEKAPHSDTTENVKSPNNKTKSTGNKKSANKKSTGAQKTIVSENAPHPENTLSAEENLPEQESPF